ncbi:diacylglycerol kinase, partial [Candidatus Berkelbacteria bacterium]|nr:diacylglycerol kinase [Candidatus Berkelbacteria bacterium]
MSFLKSFGVALRGLARVWKEERNFQVQTAVAVCVILFMFIFHLSTNERVI